MGKGEELPGSNAVANHVFESKLLGGEVEVRQPDDRLDLAGWDSRGVSAPFDAVDQITTRSVRERGRVGQEFPSSPRSSSPGGPPCTRGAAPRECHQS